MHASTCNLFLLFVCQSKFSAFLLHHSSAYGLVCASRLSLPAHMNKNKAHLMQLRWLRVESLSHCTWTALEIRGWRESGFSLLSYPIPTKILLSPANPGRNDPRPIPVPVLCFFNHIRTAYLYIKNFPVVIRIPIPPAPVDFFPCPVPVMVMNSEIDSYPMGIPGLTGF